MSEQKLRTILNTDNRALCERILEAAQYFAVLEYSNSERDKLLALESIDEIESAVNKLRASIEKIPTP